MLLLLAVSAAFAVAGGELPSDYQQVDYLESWGGQYVDTGYEPSGSTTIELKARIPAPIADTCLYSSTKSFGKSSFSCVENTDYELEVSHGSTSVTLTPARSTNFTVRQTPTGLFCDGVRVKSWSSSSFSGASLKLFSMPATLSIAAMAPPRTGARIYYAKIWNDSTLVRDLVPVRRIADGIGGLYDLVNDGFYAGANSAADPFDPVVEAERTAQIEIAGADRPRIGEPLVASSTNCADCAFVWERKGPDDAPRTTVANAAAYTPTASDREHWLIVSAVSNGLVVGRAKLWMSDLPVVYVDTDGGERITDREHKWSANLRIQGNAAFAEQYHGRTEIKGRGNTSWGYAQKSYKLKLESKTNLFGFGKNKHWVLISNNMDNSMLRNKHGSELAKALGEVGMDMTWAVVILNGAYYGVEMFAEHIRIDSNRIDVYDWEKKGEDLADGLYAAAKGEAGWKKSDKSALEELMSTNLVWIDTGVVSYGGRDWRLADYGLEEDWDLSGGYLYELEARADGLSAFRTAKLGTAINYGRPEYADSSSRLAAAGKAIWDAFESAYVSVDGYEGTAFSSSLPRHYRELADVDSMAAYWLTLECLGNYDACRFSRYSYVDRGGKLRFGPVWDFDVGGGSAWSMTGGVCALPDHWAICCVSNEKSGEFRGQNFFCEWLDDPVFAFKAYDRYWRTVRPWLVAELARNGGIETKAAYLATAAAVHCTYFAAPLISTGSDLENYRNYLEARLAWLDRQFASVDTLMTSVRNATSAAPYTKADDQVTFSFARATPTNVVSVTDYAWTAADLNLTVSTTASGAASVDVAANGISQGRLAFADGAASLKLPAAAMTAWSTNRVMVTAVVRDASGGELARNYATVVVTDPAPVTLVTDRDGNETEVEKSVSAETVIAGLRSGEKAIVSGAREVVADNNAHQVVLDGKGCPIKEYYDAKVTGVQLTVGLNDAARPELGESEPGKGDEIVMKDGELSLGVKTQAGLTYTLEASDTPGGEAGWADVKTVTGDGTVKRLTAPATSECGFFRLAAED